MIWIGWIVVILLFAVAFAGLIYPVIPSVVFIFLGFLAYGWIISFEPFSWVFWVIQLLFTVLLFFADTAANLVGVKRFGGSKAGMWGSTIGLLAGPFVIPVAGILLGPFIGAIIAELFFNRSSFVQSLRSGIGSVIGFLTSVAVKGAVMTVMIAIFVYYVW